MPLDPGSPLPLSEPAREALGHYLSALLSDLETEHTPLFARQQTLWRLYDAKPLTSIRNFPWEHASNIVVPLVRTWADSLIARHWGRLQAGPKVWVASTENEVWKDRLPPWLDYLNWAARGNVFDLFSPTWDWVSETVVTGSSHLSLRWSRKTALRYVPGSTQRPIEMEVSRGPVVEHVRRENLLYRPGSDIQDSDIVARRRWMTKSELVSHGLRAGWHKEALDHILDHPDDDQAGDGFSRADDDRRADYAGAGSLHVWDIREVWIDYPLLKAGGKAIPHPDDHDRTHPPVPLLVTMHRGSTKVLRVLTHPYYFPHWPFYDVHFRKRAGRADSDGVAQMAEMLQRQATTIVNQSNDGITLANSVNFVTTDRKFLDWRFAPNKPIVVGNIAEFRELTLSKQVVPDLGMLNSMIAMGERMFSVGDPGLGRETRMGGHPSPATNTLAMLEQMEINVSTTQRFLRNRLSQLGEDISTLFQQFEADRDNGRIETALGFKDAQAIRELILPLNEPVTGNVRFDLHAFSETFNPDAERTKAIAIDQMLTNYYGQLLQLAQILQGPMAQDPMVRDIATRAMQAKTTSMRRFLEATDFDTPEDVLAVLEDIGSQQNAQLTSAFGAVQGGPPGGAPQPGGVPPMGPPGGAPPGAQGDPFGGPGL